MTDETKLSIMELAQRNPLEITDAELREFIAQARTKYRAFGNGDKQAGSVKRAQKTEAALKKAKTAKSAGSKATFLDDALSTTISDGLEL